RSLRGVSVRGAGREVARVPPTGWMSAPLRGALVPVLSWRFLLMALSWFNRLLKTKSRPAPRGPRGRPARAQLRLETLETRELMSVTTALVGGQLLVTGDNSGNTITLQHSGTNTVVNGTSFPDSAITNGILIQSGNGNDTVNILSTVKAVTIEGQNGQDTVNLGFSGRMGAIQAAVHVKNAGGFTALNLNNQFDNGRR